MVVIFYYFQKENYKVLKLHVNNSFLWNKHLPLLSAATYGAIIRRNTVFILLDIMHVLFFCHMFFFLFFLSLLLPLLYFSLLVHPWKTNIQNFKELWIEKIRTPKVSITNIPFVNHFQSYKTYNDWLL